MDQERERRLNYDDSDNMLINNTRPATTLFTHLPNLLPVTTTRFLILFIN